ncbi:hypothetical protein IAT38_006195 [Cryptococcus sp. DSM 104549]
MVDDDKRAIFSGEESSPYTFPESGLAPSPAKRPRTVSPMGISTSIPHTFSAPSSAMPDPTSPFYPPLTSTTAGPSAYDQSYHPSPSSPYPPHLPSPHLPSPHHAHATAHHPHNPPSAQLYYPYGASSLTPAYDLHYSHPAGSSDYRSFSAPVRPSPHPHPYSGTSHSHGHSQEPSTSTSSGQTHPSPSPSLESISGSAAAAAAAGPSRPQGLGGLPLSAGVGAPHPPKGKHKGTPGPKARIPREAKIAIAEHIIAKGVSMANVDELARITGLTRQQIKSQLVDNRQNVRKQLVEAARALQ